MSREADTKKFESPENFPKVFWPPEAEKFSKFSEEPKKKRGIGLWSDAPFIF